MTRAEFKQRKRDETAARLDGVALPSGAQWASIQREAALARLLDMGLPVKRDEYWKWTNPVALTSADTPVAAPFLSDEAPVFADIPAVKITFTDGVFDAANSDDLTLEGLEISRLAEAAQTDDHWVGDLYGDLEVISQEVVERPLAALNTAYATDGILIRATAKVSKPISIVYVHTDASSDAILRHVVQVEEGASVTILESGAVAARSNTALEVDVADTGAFHHIRVQGRDHERKAVNTILARVGAECTFKSFTMTANGVLTRNEAFVELRGDDSQAHIAGLCMGDGRDFLQDDTVFITHDAERCESRQVFKKVLRNGATGVFQGKILVKDGAQKTDGYQISQSLLLDDDSQFLAKPELEIYADDVICSHGSTSGAIDEQAHFYLRSRGVPAAEATDLLTLAFLAEAIDEIEEEAISDVVKGRLEAWLSSRRA